MNPVSILFWMIPAILIALVPWLFLGWTLWASLGAGLLLVPPIFWGFFSILDRLEAEPAKQQGSEPTYEVTSEPKLKLERPEACPSCGSQESATLLYGLPAFTDELRQAIEQKKVLLAGCPVYAGAPLWQCSVCGTGHGKMILR